jgi:hypothetical protein
MSQTTPQTPPKPANNAPRARKNGKSEGLRKLKGALKDADLRQIDRRTALGSELARRRAKIVSDAGGPDAVSQVKTDLIERYLTTVVFIESVDCYLLTQSSLVNRRKRTLIPVLRERVQLVDTALRRAQAIGVELPVLSLNVPSGGFPK